MPGSDTSSSPSVSISFANNFWGKDDAGVEPLIQRMENAKTTCDELKNFYSVRAAIEEEYAKKLLSLSRKPFGSCEAGTLKSSMDTLRAETEASGKAHQNVAQQMKSDLEEPLSRYAGSLRERRKLVQSGIEKLLKVKISQTQTVNKTRNRYEQDCLRIKGYLAQGHMVMGQEERKNKQKLEKTQTALASSNQEYQNAIKALEDTTERWNREWKAACDVFQDLEEERIDTLKSSLWAFTNIASTVCVSDDASYEEVRVSLESCEVEKDITSFIRDKGTGQEIPDAPKYINFVRGDIDDDPSSLASEDNYSVAQFPRAGNATYRSSSPNPSTYSRSTDATRVRRRSSGGSRESGDRDASTVPRPTSSHTNATSEYSSATSVSNSSSDTPRRGGTLKGPNPNKYPPQMSPREDDSGGKRKSFFANSPFRRKSKSERRARDEQYQQQAQQSQRQSQRPQPHHSSSQPQPPPSQNRATWGPEHAKGYAATGSLNSRSPTRQSHIMAQDSARTPDPAGDPRTSFQLNVGENVFDVAPLDPRNQENRVHSRQGGDPRGPPQQQPPSEDTTAELDPIALALAELKGVTSNNSNGARKTADRFYGIATPAPGPGMQNDGMAAQQRGTPPPNYMKPIPRSALDAPAPAHTAASMQQTLRKYRDQTEHMLEGPPQMPSAHDAPPSRSGSGEGMHNRSNTSHGNYDRSPTRQTMRNSVDIPRAASPQPPIQPYNPHNVSPRPQPVHPDGRYSNSPQPMQPDPRRSVSPNPYAPRPGTASTYKRANTTGIEYYQQQTQQQRGRTPSPNPMMNQDRGVPNSPATYRPYSPNPQAVQQQPHQPMPMHPQHQGYQQQQPPMQRPRSQHSGSFGSPMDAQSGAIESYNPRRGRQSYYDAAGQGYATPQQSMAVGRPRSKSVVDANRGQFSRDGRPILYYARAMYSYPAAIPEELSFQKGDIMAVLRIQDDGWWEAEVMNQLGGSGLVPSNYLQQMQMLRQ